MPQASSGGSAVGTAQIVDDSITNDDINSAAAIVKSKLDLGTGIGSADLDESILKVVTRTITAAEMKTIRATPIELVAAPGAGKLIQIDRVVWSFNYVAPQYTGNGTVELQINSSTTNVLDAGTVYVFSQAEVQGVTSGTRHITGYDPVYDVASRVNTALRVANGGAAEWATGNGTVKLVIYYRIITV